MTIPLGANRPRDRFYRGGAKLAALRGEPGPAPTHEPEDWVGSTTLVASESTTGRTVLPDGRVLADAVAADPEWWLGADHIAAYGADTKLLVKLLDAGQRLPVHAHPHVDFAAAHLGLAHGKSEAWYILEGGTVHVGLRREVSADALAALVGAQDTDALLDLLHPVEVGPGDVVSVPPGTLHAIGADVLIVEVQEPSDLSILLEWRGFALDGEADGHLGLGFDTALRAIDRRVLSAADVAALVHRAGAATPLLPPADDVYFRLADVAVTGPATLPAGFAVVVVTAGEVSLGGRPHTAGDTVLVPFAAGAVPVDGHGALVVARPPAPTARVSAH